MEEFLSFIDKFKPKIEFIRFILDSQGSENNYEFLRALIYFDDQDSADNFYYEFNTKAYPFNKFEYIYSVFIHKINFFTSNDLTVYPDYNTSELACCVLCLEKIDTASSGIHTFASIDNIDRWTNYKKNCQVCSTYYNPETKSCVKCKLDNNLWCCMICGTIGCDRYQQGHAVEHFKSTCHRYSVDLHSKRIWDYLGDSWVHRSIKISEETKDMIQFDNNACEDINSKEFLTRIENVISEYNFVLSSQLEEQRSYNEKEINKLTERSDIMLKERLEELNLLKDELNKKKQIIESNKKLCKEFNKKLLQQDKRLSDIEENIKLNNELIENVKKDLNEDIQEVGYFDYLLEHTGVE